MLSRPRLLSSALASALLRPRLGRPFHATAPAPRSGGGGGSAAAAAAAASNPAMSFPCLDAIESRSEALLRQRSQSPPSPSPSSAVSPTSATSGPEPSYTTGPTLRFRSEAPLRLDWGGVLPSFEIAYETWGSLNADRSNAVLLHTGLSASSHARSTEANPRPGWWENFIGPGLSLDTDRFFVVCANVIGGCFGSTGPSSVDPADGRPYATRFPIVTLPDMVRAQFRLLDGLAIRRLHASVGSSMGGMQSLAAAALFPDRVGRVATTSACGRSHPSGIAMRHAQRQVLMMDPHWNRGFYYDGIPPHAGMKLAREIATVTYRSGPEWGKRFGRRRADPTRPPALCPDFLIETYLDHAGEKFCLTYDPNSLLYVSKAMDLFDLGRENQAEAEARRRRRVAAAASPPPSESGADACSLTLPDRPYEEQVPAGGGDPEFGEGPGEDLVAGLAPLRDTPTLVMGVATDILFPAWQQREVADALRLGGNKTVVHRELSQEESLFGHDTFLLDLAVIGKTLKVFLEG